jgi:hypothetical protein
MSTYAAPVLEERLHAAWNWIDSAGEWEESLADPDAYAAEAANNWRDNGSGDEVTVSDLLAVILWEQARRGRQAVARG